MKTNQNKTTFKTPSVQMALQELRDTAKDISYQYHIVEVIAGEECFDREYGNYTESIFVLRNGMEIEEDIYDCTVKRVIRHFVCALHNEGFLDSQGFRWRVDNLDLENYEMSQFQISQPFSGPTELYHLIQKIKSLPDVPFYLPHELDLYPHIDEKDLLSRMPPNVQGHFLEMKGQIK